MTSRRRRIRPSARVDSALAEGPMVDSRLLTRVKLRHYKSIAACDVEPGQLSFLVGPNGAGKSNFLDALRFVADSLRYSLDHAIRDRGGINEVRRRSGGHPTHLGLRLEFQLPSGAVGHYAFDVGAKKDAGYSIQREECLLQAKGGRPAFFRVEDGRVSKATMETTPSASKDRLYLVAASGIDAFRPVYDALSQMGFYNLNPEAIRDLQSPDPGELLNRDGSNIASVLANMSRHAPDLKKRIEEYLSRVVPGVSGVERIEVGPKETLEFRQDVKGAEHPWRFYAANMSDGTLRAFGVLVALFQHASNGAGIRHLVGIEEPEIALHPAAASILTDSLRQASSTAQVLVTSHSPDLLDDESTPHESILAVVAEEGETKIARLDETGRSALRDRLYTVGELLRMDQLRPDPTASGIRAEQLKLFGPEP
jgi:predicted ATPase